ncbi:MAG: antibiotic biosynthesis monooxygenase [Planctomycetaceae bacterium]|nr:antibiotic biosynthesis monooxygenase [Planctomycetaceae bacterium]|tara:strand:- start:486 stop:824 length:339 start_codon:yes stop_codon:yes gene_type:complete
MFSIFVTINVLPEHVEEFKNASLGDSEGSVRDEPECYRFDINQDESIPTRFYLYEVYQDENAFEHHLTTPHFLTWKAKVEPWFVGDLDIVRMNTVFPSTSGWRAQKPSLLNF